MNNFNYGIKNFSQCDGTRNVIGLKINIFKVQGQKVNFSKFKDKTKLMYNLVTKTIFWPLIKVGFNY